MKKIFTLCALAIGVSLSASAQEEKLVVKPSGRILMDAGVMHAKEQSDKLNTGVAIPDLRLGVKATYGKWTGKVDVGFAYGQVSMKDINLDYNFDTSNLLRLGYFVHQFGLQSATSSSFKITMEEPASNQAFFNSRLLGAMYVHSRGDFFGTASVFAESDAMKMTTDKLGNESLGAMTRLVYRQLRHPGRLFHVGLSAATEAPRYNSTAALDHKSFTLKSPFPTRIANVTAVQATITEASQLYKFSPELCFAQGRVGFEGQYYYVHVNRNNNLPAYKAQGAYGAVRGLLKGRHYTYTETDCGIDTPAPGSMELVAAYNYTDMSDHKADILGGRLNDWSLTYNYYLNKYMIWRVRASYTTTSDRAGYADNNFSILETRLQIKF